jgi:hypothetical protein
MLWKSGPTRKKIEGMPERIDRKNERSTLRWNVTVDFTKEEYEAANKLAYAMNMDNSQFCKESVIYYIASMLKDPETVDRLLCGRLAGIIKLESL